MSVLKKSSSIENIIEHEMLSEAAEKAKKAASPAKPPQPSAAGGGGNANQATAAKQLPTYQFKYGFLRDVVYQLMLFSQRRFQHSSVAKWLEQRLEMFLYNAQYITPNILNRHKRIAKTTEDAMHVEDQAAGFSWNKFAADAKNAGNKRELKTTTLLGEVTGSLGGGSAPKSHSVRNKIKNDKALLVRMSSIRDTRLRESLMRKAGLTAAEMPTVNDDSDSDSDEEGSSSFCSALICCGGGGGVARQQTIRTVISAGKALPSHITENTSSRRSVMLAANNKRSNSVAVRGSGNRVAPAKSGASGSKSKSKSSTGRSSSVSHSQVGVITLSSFCQSFLALSLLSKHPLLIPSFVPYLTS
jgi:hypothetical protein